MSLTVNSTQTYSSTNPTDSTDVLAISSTIVVVSYRKSSVGYVRAGTLNGDGTISWGTEQSLGSDYRTINLGRLDDTSFLVVLASSEEVANETLDFRIGTLSGNSISLGSGQNWGGAANGNQSLTRISGLSSSSFIVLYDNSNLKLRACTISSGTITFGSETSLAGSPRGSTTTSLATLTSTLFVAGYVLSSDNNTYIVAATVSGTTITLGSSVSIQSGNTSFGIYSSCISLSRLDNTSFVVGYNSNTGFSSGYENSLRGRVCTISGTTITAGSQTTLLASDGSHGYRPYVCGMSSDKFLMAYMSRNISSGTWDYSYIGSWSVSGTTITSLDADTLVAQAGSGSTSPPTIRRLMSNLPATSEIAVMGFRNNGSSNNGQAVIINFVSVVGPANLKTIDGLAKASIKTVYELAIASVKSIDGLN